MQVAIITWNEKGFWQGDLWHDWAPDDPEGISPDDFFVCSKDSILSDALLQAATSWPDAFIRVDDDREAD